MKRTNGIQAPLWLILVLTALTCGHCAVHEQDPITSPFPLEGAHADLACSDCHPGGDYVNAPPRNCVGCHEDHRPAPHWLDECDECHGQEVWDDEEFEHEDYELTGAHLEAECLGCHAEQEEWDEPDDVCSVCHDADRPEGHIDLDCADCHSTDDWEDPTWPHGFFALDGGHDGLMCTSCHADGYHDTPDDCHDCHADDAPPGHPSQNCDQCHDIYSWGDHNFTHDFSLTGAHASLTCVDCHADGYEGTSSQCEGCHTGTAPQGHPTSGCTDCHEPTQWSDTTFDHDFFPLEGGHSNPTCESCHAGQYSGFAADCQDCHTDDSPHAFFTECAWCHDIYGW